MWMMKKSEALPCGICRPIFCRWSVTTAANSPTEQRPSITYCHSSRRAAGPLLSRMSKGNILMPEQSDPPKHLEQAHYSDYVQQSLLPPSCPCKVTQADLGTSCRAGLPLMLLKLVQLAAEPLILPAVQGCLCLTRLQRTPQAHSCTHCTFVQERAFCEFWNRASTDTQPQLV